MPQHERIGKHWLLLAIHMHDKCYIVFDLATTVGNEHTERLVRSAVRVDLCCKCCAICIDIVFFPIVVFNPCTRYAQKLAVGLALFHSSTYADFLSWVIDDRSCPQ